MGAFNLRVSRAMFVSLLTIAAMGAGSMRAEQVTANILGGNVAAIASPTEELIFLDGDILRGRLITKEGEVLVFESHRFGLIRVSTKVAEVQSAGRTENAGSAMLPGAPTPSPSERSDPGSRYTIIVSESRWADRATGRTDTRPTWLPRAIHSLIEPWHGKLSISAELVTDATKRQSYALNSQMVRKWGHDELQLNARYDYSETTGVTNTNLLKIDALWHHDLSRRWFIVYRPLLEWNRAYRDPRGIATEYVLLHQEAGLGVNLLKGRLGHVSTGFSENQFDVCVTAPGNQHFSHSVQSVFAEAEWKLPCNITLNNRGVFYYSISSTSTGWENKLEIEKRLTEKLSIGARNEVRRNNPDVRISNFNRTLLYLGFGY